MDYSVKDTWYL